ncbi:XRE family transcriptional regulator [soil metagenome]
MLAPTYDRVSSRGHNAVTVRLKDYGGHMTVEDSAPAAAQSISEMATRRLGSEIRRTRIERGLTLVDISAATGLSVSMLSMLERGKTGASVGSLVAVASALGVAVGDLFHPASTPDSLLVRRDAQPELVISPGVTRRIIQRSREYGLEVTALQLDPGTHTGDEFVRHEGQEIVVVQAGALTVQINDDSFELTEGDSIRLDADSPHRFANEGAAVSHVLLVVRLPTHSQHGH